MRNLLELMTVLVALAGSADVTVSDVAANQRWPWSEKVDVDFLVTGGAADVEVTATWDGHPTPYELGTVLEVKSGWNRFTWDPAASPFAGQTLTGFSVSVFKGSAATNRYLIVDLVSGEISYAARPDGTDGRWSDTYKKTKMAFRRVPGGSYSLGMTDAELTRWFGTSTADEKRTRGARTQTFSSDFYLAVFQLTDAQYETVVGDGTSGNLLPKLITYEELRGSTNATDGICWPTTGHAVAPNSFLGRLRSRLQTPLVVDLPEEEQWEAAVRADSVTVFPNGGLITDDTNVLWSVYGRSSWYHGNGGTVLKEVGLRDPDNSRGFYDMLANRVEWTLDVWKVDAYGRTVKTGATTDPVGAETWQGTEKVTNENNRKKIVEAYGKRVVRSAYPQTPTATLPYVLPSIRNGRLTTAGDVTARLCVHLKSLVSR